MYKDIQAPKIGGKCFTKRESDNPKDKYAVCVKKNDCIMGHLPLGKSGNITKTILHFLRADEYSLSEVVITGKPVNLGDGDGMQVPGKLKFTGRTQFVNILENTIKSQNIVLK